MEYVGMIMQNVQILLTLKTTRTFGKCFHVGGWVFLNQNLYVNLVSNLFHEKLIIIFKKYMFSNIEHLVSAQIGHIKSFGVSVVVASFPHKICTLPCFLFLFFIGFYVEANKKKGKQKRADFVRKSCNYIVCAILWRCHDASYITCCKAIEKSYQMRWLLNVYFNLNKYFIDLILESSLKFIWSSWVWFQTLITSVRSHKPSWYSLSDMIFG